MCKTVRLHTPAEQFRLYNKCCGIKVEHNSSKSYIMELTTTPIQEEFVMLCIDYTQKLLNLQGVLVKKVTSAQKASSRLCH